MHDLPDGPQMPETVAVSYLESKFLLLLLLMVSLALGWILQPLFGAMLWAVILALLFMPLNRRLLLRLPGRRNLAALLTLLFVLVMVILPMAMIAAALAREAAQLYQRVQSGALNPVGYLHSAFDTLPAWAAKLLDQLGLSEFANLQQRLTQALRQGSEFIATQVFSAGQITFEFFVSLSITLYLAFFLIRDGAQLMRAIGQAVPLAPAHKQELFSKFVTVVRATVKGNFLVAAIQGALGGLAFWFLDIGAALLWAVLMAFLSLLPAIGAGLVWLPVALYLLMSGALWQGLTLCAYGVLVIGLVDNLLRPVLVGKDTRMPDYVVMITTLGGMSVFGINGFVLGPVIAAMFIAVWHLHGKAYE